MEVCQTTSEKIVHICLYGDEPSQRKHPDPNNGYLYGPSPLTDNLLLDGTINSGRLY